MAEYPRGHYNGRQAPCIYSDPELAMTLARFLFPLLLIAVTIPVRGAEPPRLVPAFSHRVTDIVDGDTLVLETGLEVRLVGIQAPKLPLGRPGFDAWPLAADAKAALAELAADRLVGLTFTGRRKDRHGRWLAHLTTADGAWIQGKILERGLARVYSFADNRALVAEMLEIERRARAARRGIWANSFYAVRSPTDVQRRLGSFQLVEGRVLDAARVRGRVYLNFGADCRSDFTVSISPAAWRLFEAAGLDLDGYRAARLRVRGWVTSRNGPMIEATHPEQIEVLE